MMIEREHTRLSRPLLDVLQHNGIVAEIRALFHAITYHEAKQETDTSIAWEDGEIEVVESHSADGQ